MMPTTNVRKHIIPLGSEVSLTRQVIYTDFGESIHDVIPVANATERAQLVSDMVAKGKGPSASNPLVVYRADAPGLHRVESSTDGLVWVPASGQLWFADIAAANSFATANPGLLSNGDECAISRTVYTYFDGVWYGAEIDLTLQNGFTAMAEGIKAVRIGRVVYLIGGVVRAAAPTSGAIAFSVPPGYRPRAQIRAAGRATAQYVIEVNGAVTIADSVGYASGVGWAFGHFSWIAA